MPLLTKENVCFLQTVNINNPVRIDLYMAGRTDDCASYVY